MRSCELLVVGGGPAGLCAAINAAKAGAHVIVLERNPSIGGQLRIEKTARFYEGHRHSWHTRIRDCRYGR